MSLINAPIGAHTLAGGTATITGAGTTVFNIPHGLGATPTLFGATAANALAAAAFYVTADAKNVIVTYLAGLTGPVAMAWFAMA